MVGQVAYMTCIACEEPATTTPAAHGRPDVGAEPHVAKPNPNPNPTLAQTLTPTPTLTDVDEQVAGQREHQEQERGVERARHEARPLLELVRRVVPVVPRYAVRTARPRLVRVRRTYSAWGPGTSCPAPQVRTARRRLVRVSRVYSTEAPEHTCKLSVAPEAEQRRIVEVLPVSEWSTAVKSAALEAARSSTRGSGWAPSGSASVWECRAAWSRQARPGEALLEPSWGTAKRASLTVLQFCEAMPVWDVGMADAIVRVKVAPACEHEVEPAITASSLGSPGI